MKKNDEKFRFRGMDILHLLARGEKEIAAGTGYALDDVLRETDLYLEAAKL